jgi:hypothetical protein
VLRGQKPASACCLYHQTLTVINILELVKPLYKQFLILAVALLMKGSLMGQNNQSYSLSFTITERILPGGTQFEYEYYDGILSVYEVPQISIIIHDDKVREPSQENGKYRVKLKSSQILSVDSIVRTINPMNLDTLYSSATIDGVNWTLQFKLRGETKKIFLNNYYLAQLDPLLNYINELLPRDKRVITFDFVSKK